MPNNNCYTTFITKFYTHKKEYSFLQKIQEVVIGKIAFEFYFQ